ncbi:MFS transporter [Kribbella sp. NPDC051620]|uniref:MFS transporter n=1 Tax=Kribbella sp. NPDC051620 TaxID=3364120 RepID=UPI003799CAAE
MTGQSTTEPSRSPDQDTTGRYQATVTVLVLVELLSGLVQGTTPALVPQLGKELGISPADLSLIASVNLLSAAISVPIIGRLGDMYGHRRMMRIALLLALTGAALFAFGPNFGVMLVGQAFLGALAGVLPLELGIVRSRIQGPRARSAVGFLFATVMLGGVAGFVVAGVAHSSLGSARSALVIPVVLLAIAVLLSVLFVPDSSVRAVRAIDWAGAATLSGGLLLLLWTVSGARERSPLVTVLLLGGAAALLTAWARIELRVEHPMVDVRTLVQPQLLRFYLASLLLGVGLIGSQTIGLTFLAADRTIAGYGLDLTPERAIPVLVGAGVCGVLGAALMGVICRTFGTARTVVVSICLEVVVNLVFVVHHDSLALFMIVTPIAAFGSSLAFSSILALITERSDGTKVAMATGMYNTLRALGGSLGAAVFAFVLSTLRQPGSTLPTEGAYITSWFICAACGTAAALFVVLLGRTTRVGEAN